MDGKCKKLNGKWMENGKRSNGKWMGNEKVKWQIEVKWQMDGKCKMSDCKSKPNKLIPFAM